MLAGMEGPVGGHPVDRDQRPVEDDVGVPLLLRLPHGLAQPRRAGCQQRNGLVRVSPGCGGTDSEPGGEIGERLTFAQVGKQQKCLPPGVQLPPA
jgi:hypothetical protein